MQRIGALWLLAALLGLVACPTAEPTDDDDSAVDDDDDDDDDTTPPPDPLADLIGIFNLTNVRQPGGTDYVDFSGGFGTFAPLAPEMVAPAAYLSQWGYDSPLWRFDLGAWPLPLEGEYEVLDLLAYTPWVPNEQTWWDAGDRIGLGPYLTRRLQEDVLLAYQVDDPLSPGGAAWPTGGEVVWQNAGGLDVVEWLAPTGAPVPLEAELLEPLAGAVITSPAARDLTIRWTPQADDATVTIVMLQGLGVAYVANVPDTGEHDVPSAALHDELGVGTMELILARQIETTLEHPQGDILLRTRVEQRAEVVLLPDLTLDPAYGSSGTTFDIDVAWYTGLIDATTFFDLGAGVTVDASVPHATDPQRATITVTIDPTAEVGARSVFLSTGIADIDMPDAFTVLNVNPSDDCATAETIGALGEGYYVSTTVGLANDYRSDYACIDWSLNGADAIYRVDLEAGQTVVIQALQPYPGDAAIALLSSCGEPSSAVACADATFEGEIEEIVYTAETTGPMYLAIDGYFLSGFGAPSGPFELGITIPLPPSPITPPWIVPGETQALAILGPGPWDAGVSTGDVDLGDGVSALNVASGGQPDELMVNASASSAATPGVRTVTITNGAAGDVVLEDALFVTGWPANDSCAEADAWGPVENDVLTGWAPNTTNTIDQTGCFTWSSAGTEVILALDLTAGQTLSAYVESWEDTQLYVLSDCGDPENSCISDASSDDGFAGDPEEITLWEVPTTGRYYLVVDLFAAALDPFWSFDLTLDVQDP